MKNLKNKLGQDCRSEKDSQTDSLNQHPQNKKESSEGEQSIQETTQHVHGGRALMPMRKN
jgi:hypothetical protein